MGVQPWNDDDHVKQRRFFPETVSNPPPLESPLVPLPPITRHTSLANLARHYHRYLLLNDHTAHTIDCFLSDLRLLARTVGLKTLVGTLHRAQVWEWAWSQPGERGVPPAPKSVARRITFLHNFFGWLTNQGVLEENPVADLPKPRPLPPLPELLDEGDLARLVQAAQSDVRCHLLILLALEGGLKKEEILALTPERVDLSDPSAPTVAVRLPDPARTTRSRLVALPPVFSSVYPRYMHLYQPLERVFDCTDRNLTYILAKAIKRAKLDKRVTLHLLRDCYAVRQLRSGVSLKQVREKLGLTEDAWYEAQERYRALAFPG